MVMPGEEVGVLQAYSAIREGNQNLQASLGSTFGEKSRRLRRQLITKSRQTAWASGPKARVQVLYNHSTQAPNRCLKRFQFILSHRFYLRNLGRSTADWTYYSRNVSQFSAI